MAETDQSDIAVSWVLGVEACLHFDLPGFEVKGEGRVRGEAKGEARERV